MRNIFLEKSYTKVVKKLFQDLLLKNRNQTYLWINYLQFFKVWFYSMPSMLKLRCRPLVFTSVKSFFFKKRGLELVSLPYFLHDFWTENIWPNLLPGHFLRYWEKCVTCVLQLFVNQVWRHEFWN